MTIVAVVLDERPDFLGGGHEPTSLLLLPTPEGMLAQEVARAVRAVTSHRPYILTARAESGGYTSRLREAWPAAAVLESSTALRDVIAALDPADLLLFVSPACYPAHGLDLRALCTSSTERMPIAEHLLAADDSSFGTRELVQTGEDGRIRRIQRYFAPVTWPFSGGVVASVIPVACLHVLAAPPYHSLAELRQRLSASGVPARDVPLGDAPLDLTDEGGALALMERRVMTALERRQERELASVAEASLRSPRATIHPSARFVGPVAVHDDAVVAAGALIVGPALVGARARVEEGAVVAQCLVLPDARVVQGATVRHRVVASSGMHSRQDGQRRHAPARATPGGARVVTRGVRYVAIRAVVEPAIALVALLVLAPVLALIALSTKLDSPGPLFYGDPREGRSGRPFRCWKFRTMRANADAMQGELAAQQEMDGPQFKMSNDPRVTRTGRWLRRLNLDELPQLWNVVRGEMSFVGPRPSPFRENQICVPWRNGRLSVTPGITGLWQVCRHNRASGDFHQWIHYDLLYVRNVSLRTDLRILAATILTLGGRRPVKVARILGASAAPVEDEAADPVGAVRAATRPRRRSGDHWRAPLANALLIALGVAPVAISQRPMPARPVVFFLSADAGLERNPHLRADADSAPDQMARVRAGAVSSMMGPRGALTFMVAGETVNYQVGRDLNRATYELLADGRRMLSPRTTGRLGAAYRTVLSSELFSTGPVGSEAGGANPSGPPNVTLLPLSLARSVSAWTELSRRMTSLTTATMRAAYTSVAFDSPLLLPGRAFTAHGDLRRRYSSDGAVLLSADAQDGRSQGVPLQTQTIASGWESNGQRTSVQLLAGVTHSAPATGDRVTPTGSATVRQRSGPGALTFHFQRAVSQAYGLGQLFVNDETAVGYELTSKTKVIRLAGVQLRSADPASSVTRLTTTSASLELRRLLASGFSFGTRIYYRERESGTRLSGSGIHLLAAYALDER